MPRNPISTFYIRLKVLAMLLFLVALASCGAMEQKEFNTGYYPLRSFMLEEVQRHSYNNTQMDKAVYLEGQWEEQTVQPADSAAWQTELAAFMEANINLPANQGLYKVDTLFVDTDSLTRITYLATKKDLRTRYLYVYLKPGTTRPELIEAHLEQENILYSSVQDLVYMPDSGYSITGYQDVLILGLDSFAVKANFIR